MKQKVSIIIILLLAVCRLSYPQEFNKNIDKDSLFQAILEEIPEERRDEFKKTYEEGNNQSKEFLLLMFSMPRSSKTELVDNYESKSKEIEKLKREYKKIVPDSLIISIEFNPENSIFRATESIDLKICRHNVEGRNSVIQQEWDLDWKSEKLSEMLLLIGWTSKTLNDIKNLLDSANCVSIKNGKNTTIGFARSGMGKYSYKIFDSNLTDNQIEGFNDGCTYIYYKDNIVLEYGGGAVGPQCFPDQ